MTHVLHKPRTLQACTARLMTQAIHNAHADRHTLGPFSQELDHLTCAAHTSFPLLLQAFTKVTHLEPDNGEAWTNLAALWLQQGGWREALQASEQAVKYKRDSWQTWDNYATAAAKAGGMSSCVRALAQVGWAMRAALSVLSAAGCSRDDVVAGCVSVVDASLLGGSPV